ncbi:hypothetical protein K458DRAFT_5754 [Lentithecium fluviatile CBS 122367]|uniref:Uncharacterized protein n=1 Tax=Lentithecium fluviatile CBS 122367 TaxID=1168545 RepID=A0A6G1JNK7_9PLEO|nr:hypothetical protein K458DRAFT_5754 [Lentithecium fluviatile CBS 122367]
MTAPFLLPAGAGWADTAEAFPSPSGACAWRGGYGRLEARGRDAQRPVRAEKPAMAENNPWTRDEPPVVEALRRDTKGRTRRGPDPRLILLVGSHVLASRCLPTNVAPLQTIRGSTSGLTPTFASPS